MKKIGQIVFAVLLILLGAFVEFAGLVGTFSLFGYTGPKGTLNIFNGIGFIVMGIYLLV